MHMSNAASGAASSGVPHINSSDVQEYIVKRDNERPWSFAGVCLAKQRITSVLSETVCAAVYRTVAGKFIVTLSKDSPLERLANAGLQIQAVFDQYAVNTPVGDRKQSNDVYNKAALFDSIEDALAWFKPGRLTDALRKELGQDEPIRID